MNKSTCENGPADITDHQNQRHSVDLSACTFRRTAIRPDYLDVTPKRIGSDWIYSRLMTGTPLDLWQTADSNWFVLDRNKCEGVFVNLDQLHDLHPMPSVTLETQNFRALTRTVWTPVRVCVLVGPNGSGKTTLLALLDFIRNAYLRGGAAAIEHNNGVYGLRSWGAQEYDPVIISLSVGDLRWELQLTSRGPTLSDRLGERVTIGDELVLSRAPLSQRLLFRGKEYLIPDGDDRLGIRFIVDAQRPDELDSLVRVVTTTRVYQSYNIWGLRNNGSRQASDLFLHPNGQNALTVLRNWRDRRDLKYQYDFVVKSLRKAFPEMFAELDFHVAGMTTTADLIAPGSQYTCPLALAPNGWIAGLLHLTAVAGAAKGSMIAIDDFGNDLHPYAIRAITEAIRDWSETRDLVVCLASHSPVLLDEFKEQPCAVFVMQSELPERPVPLTELYDRDWLARFSLGRLYEHGEYGGQQPVPSDVTSAKEAK